MTRPVGNASAGRVIGARLPDHTEIRKAQGAWASTLLPERLAILRRFRHLLAGRAGRSSGDTRDGLRNSELTIVPTLAGYNGPARWISE